MNITQFWKKYRNTEKNWLQLINRMPRKRFTCLLLIRFLTFLLTCVFTYLLTAWSRILLKKLTGSQLVKKLPTFNGTRKFVTGLQKPTTCPYPEPDHSSPCPPAPSHFLTMFRNIIPRSMAGSY
jgi:hypothetical protein